MQPAKPILYHGDCLDVLRCLPANSIDSVVTDPPYHLTSVVKRFGSPDAAPAKFGTDGAFARASTGFMGKVWDGGDVAFRPETWVEILRVLKPGGHLAAFGASRGYHRMACAIEDAGFEIRDSLAWLYGVGFPKSHNISGHESFCQCGAEQATERNLRPLRCADVSPPEHIGTERGQVLQPSVSQCDPQGIRTEQDEGVARVAQSFVEGRSDVPAPQGQLRSGEVRSVSAGICTDGEGRRLRDGASLGDGSPLPPPPDANRMRTSSRSQTAEQRTDQPRTVAGQSQSQDGGAWSHCGRCGKSMVPDGLGTALKPAFEPIVLARKPLSEGTVAANVLRWGTGALNIDGCRVGTESTLRNCNAGTGDKANWRTGNEAGVHGSAAGRWPANVVHDGSDEVIEAFPSVKARGNTGESTAKHDSNIVYGKYNSLDCGERYNHEAPGTTGSAARFFYSAKASKADRAGSKHPTVKPVALMQWLCRLITPPGGHVLDPFAGSGTTGAAALQEGFRPVLIEREDEYVRDILNRFANAA